MKALPIIMTVLVLLFIAAGVYLIYQGKIIIGVFQICFAVILVYLSNKNPTSIE